MQIAHMLGTSTSSALEAVYGDPKRKKELDGAPTAALSGDTVSISAKALELAAQMQADKSAPDRQNAAGGEAEEQNTEQGAGQSGGVGMGASTGDQLAEIEGKIKELQQKISSIQNSAMPEESKQATISGLQAQIESLLQQLNALKAQVA